MPLPDQRFHLSQEKPQPGVPYIEPSRYWSVPARIARTISSCVRSNSSRAVLSLSVAPLRCHSESKSSIGPLAFPLTFVCRATAKTPAIHFGVRPALGDVGKAGKIYGLRPVVHVS